MQTDEEIIVGIIASRADAVAMGDAAGIVTHLAQDVKIFDVVMPLQRKGKQAAHDRAAEWLASYDGSPRWENLEVRVFAAAPIAFAHMISHVTGAMKNGKAVDMWFRTTLGFEQRAGIWLIVHDHGSDPFDPATGEAKTGLRP